MNSYWQRVAPASAKILLAMGVFVLSACSSAPPQQSKATPAPVTQEDKTVTKIDINEIFPAGPGRALVINNCTTCHTIVPIVVLQLNEEAWKHWRTIHRSRVPALSDADFETLYVYLKSNFNPSRPVPKLPQDLLDTWTSY